jgi:hypothetical protein
MLTPEKHMNLDASVLRSGAILLSSLQKSRIVPLPKLRDDLTKAIGDDAEFVFIPAVNFLFLIGRLDYHPSTDSFEYLKGGRR